MKKLIEFAKNYKARYNYLPEEVLEDAKESGLLSTYKEIESRLTNERRWGVDQETVYEVDGKHILFNVYTLTGNSTGDDELNDVYEVEPKEVMITKWSKI